MNRLAIPRQLEREILMEAGHRCAIPTCRQTPVEIVHIIPWEQVKKHTFDNLIALCPTCHTRYHKRGEIDRKAMQQYKANLTVLNGRFGELEQRVLRLCAKQMNEKSGMSHWLGEQSSVVPGPLAEQLKTIDIWLPGGFDILLMNLLKDGFLTDTGQNSGIILAGVPSAKLYRLTNKGREFIQKWLSAEELK